MLVASDAVGMGLNLNIRRIVFHSVEKFEGLEKVVISPSQIKQIAGRAGRRNRYNLFTLKKSIGWKHTKIADSYGYNAHTVS